MPLGSRASRSDLTGRTLPGTQSVLPRAIAIFHADPRDSAVHKKLIELDSLRALMAFAVFVSHAQFLSGTEIWSLSLGGIAVTVFIMLSGFAITKSLVGSTATYRQYLARRFWRIYPAYLIGLLLGLCVSWHTPDLLQHLGWVHAPSVARIAQRTAGEHALFWPHLGAHLVLLHGAIPDAVLYGSALTFNSPAWSLSLEWQFYLLAPAIIALVQASLRLPLAGRLIACVLTLLVLIYVRAALAPWYDQVPSFLPQQLIFFLVGILSALRLEWAVATRTRLLACSAALVLLGVALGDRTAVLATGLWTLTLASCAHTAPAWLLPVRRALSMPRLVLAGEASYSFYIIHEPLMLAAADLIHRAWPTRSHHGFELALLLTVVPIGAIAWLMFTRIEMPINRWARAQFHGTRTAAAAAA